VSERWILNASPLIVLARVGQTRLFTALAERVMVPSAVAAEIDAGPDDDPARAILQARHFEIIAAPPAAPELLNWDLGAGETAVLSVALAEPGWIAILDDAAARKCARSFSLPVKGTLAVVLLARQKGLIPSAVEVLRSIRASGFRLDDRVIEEALARTVGERWSP
jgi:predicted nucleic acid-binding protein